MDDETLDVTVTGLRGDVFADDEGLEAMVTDFRGGIFVDDDSLEEMVTGPRGDTDVEEGPATLCPRREKTEPATIFSLLSF